MISWLRWVSRLPVGSSASSTAGSVTMARAMATRCCCPPDSSAGVWCSQPPRPTDCSARAAAWRTRGGLAAVEQRQLDVLLRRGARQQVEALEHEAQVAPPQPARWSRDSALDLARPEQVGAGGGRVQAAQQMFIAVDLPEPLGPMMATNSPAAMSRSTPLRAWKAAWRVPGTLLSLPATLRAATPRRARHYLGH
jgi:hypothetical protein